jgi:hypothetical protein
MRDDSMQKSNSMSKPHFPQLANFPPIATRCAYRNSNRKATLGLFLSTDRPTDRSTAVAIEIRLPIQSRRAPSLHIIWWTQRGGRKKRVERQHGGELVAALHVSQALRADTNLVNDVRCTIRARSRNDQHRNQTHTHTHTHARVRIASRNNNSSRANA